MEGTQGPGRMLIGAVIASVLVTVMGALRRENLLALLLHFSELE